MSAFQTRTQGLSGWQYLKSDAKEVRLLLHIPFDLVSNGSIAVVIESQPLSAAAAPAG